MSSWKPKHSLACDGALPRPLAFRDKDITQAQYQTTMKFLNARPCVGVDRTLSVAMKAKFAPAIAKTEGVKKIEMLAAFRFKEWRILYVAQAHAENNFFV